LLQRTAAFGAAVAGTLVFPAPPRAANSRPSARIVIVGAGLAGLTCAYRLRQAGYAARVIEAADYVGGRCKTRRGFFEEGQLIEQGGELIDQSHTAIRQLAQELGLATDNLLQAEAGDTEAGYYFDGGFYSYEEATADIKGIWQKLHRDLVEASYPTTFDRFTPRGWELDHMSIIDWINETVPGGLDSRLGQLLDVAYTIEYGAESSEQSALNLLYLLGFSGQGQLRIFGPSNEKYHVRGGNDQLPARLAEALPDQIQLGSALVAVKRNADGTYSVTLKPRAGRTQTVTADKLVLALPFSILRASVDLTKAGFSALKQTAIREQGMGTNTKLQLQFSDRHWRALGHNGESYADTGYQATWEVSRAQPGQAGILVDYTGGLIGASFNSGTPASRAQQFLAQIEPLLPGLSAKWNGKVTLDYWPGYQWTRGSYSYWKVGQYTRFAGIEGARAGNCFFAGEHTSIDSQGYLNGAVESGGRVAEEILADLRGGSARLAGASAE
jgi:monoamine oxidase